MLIRKRKLAVAMRVLLLCSLLATLVFAQKGFAETYTLSGKVTDSAGHAVPSATVTAKSVANGKTLTAETGSDGTYSIHDLAGGDYEVSAVAGELQAPPIKVTLAAWQTMDLVATPAANRVENLPHSPQQH